MEFSAGINIITGPNAAGKTNILEAISVTSNVKSFRNVPDTEIIQWGRDNYYCCSKIGDSENSIFEIGCDFFSGAVRKKAKIDGIEKKRISDYYGKFLSVIFSPEDINIINGPPEARRRFFDGIISKADAAYLKTISDYRKILLSRNRILRDIIEKKKNTLSGLDAYDEMLSGRASVIIKKRTEFMNTFRNSFVKAYSEMSPGDEAPEILYLPALETDEGTKILQFLKDNRTRDIKKGATGTGPHRDDYVLKNSEGIIFKNYASQGQKRSASVSLRIAETVFIEKRTGSAPVILLDDIFAELDEGRRHNLLEKIVRKNQTIITSANEGLVRAEKFAETANFTIESNGSVKRS
ncbi:MAG: DNA replication and repair protein RecF [Spirochaetes bacterium]|nr:DNA replication and repair protein RecF [Spirochaetota bacterium]